MEFVAALNDTRTTTERGYGWRWQKFRKAWLAKHPLCGDRLNGSSNEHSLCVATGRTVAANIVDHIVPFRGDEGLQFDEGNLQSLCKPCHDRKTAMEDGGFIAEGHTRYVVTGKPGCGKTTWVRQRAKPGDIVFDLDEIAGIVTGYPCWPRPDPAANALLSMRRGLVDWLSQTGSFNASVYVIVTSVEDAEYVAKRIKAKLMNVQQLRERRTEGGSQSLTQTAS